MAKGLKTWEGVLVGTAVLALIGGGVVYYTGFPIGKYLFGLGESDAGKQIATLTRADAGVRRQRVGESDFQGVGTGAPLYNEDTIVTPPDGTDRIEFTDGSFIEMAPSSMVRLSFGGDMALGGVERSVQVITGNVTGQGQITVKSGGEKIALQPPKPSPRPVRPSPRPSPSPLPPPSPSPSPSPSPKQQTSKTVIIYPKDGSALAVPTGSQAPELPLTFDWQMRPRAAAVNFRLLRRTPKTILLFRKTVKMNSNEGRLPLALKQPGQYRWEISTATTPEVLLAAANFTVDPRYQALTLNDATVGGTKAQTSQLAGKVLKNFDITFSWLPYASQQKYELSFFLRPGGKSIWSRQVEGTFYTMNEGKVFTGQVYYQLATRTSNGFMVLSPLHQFDFRFSPPVPKIPENGAQLSKKQLMKEENQILFTWEKTNFTSSYMIQVSTDPSFQTLLTTQTTPENFFVIKDPQPGTYYWRLQSFSGNQKASGASAVSSFTVGP